MTAATSEELLQEQLEQITTQSRRKPKAVKPAFQVGISYNAQLQAIVREIKKDIDAELLPVIRATSTEYSTQDSAPVTTNDTWFTQIQSVLERILNKWNSPEFRASGDQLAYRFVTTADKTNRDRMTKSMGVDIFNSEPELDDYVQASVYNNAKLIRSIPDQYLGQVENIVLTNVRAGGRPGAIEALLRDQFGVSQRKAKFIARDQTSKVNGELSSRRQQNAGFQYFQWVDSDDSRVRDRHEEIADKITAYGKGVYRWDNPPLSDKGDPIIPGQDYGCRCTARPVGESEVEKNQEAGRTRPGVHR